MKVAVLGGGAAGFFAAIAVKQKHPKAIVTIFEKSQKLLSKVKVSGGGRCNVTNACFSISELSQAYPRGGKQLKKVFPIFNTKHTMDWFEQRNVPLKIEANNHVFPVSNDSQTIINCLLKEAEMKKIKIICRANIVALQRKGDQYKLVFQKENVNQNVFDRVIVSTGGSPKRVGLEWLEQLGHEIEDPVPSLFTFNMPNEKITQLMGVAIENVHVKIQGAKLKNVGPLLITHWGMSGPAILKLSAFGARILSEMQYHFNIQINWTNEINDQVVLQHLTNISEKNPNKILANIKPFELPERLWLYFLDKTELAKTKKWGELGKKGLNKLTNILTHDIYAVKGKTTFKEEFVTCGGVSLECIDIHTMQSKNCKGLYFAGEVMDIDAITGGYNFQAAWTTGFIAGQLK